MKQALGITWRKKIAMEANLLSALQHPFMVNLKYAFQNPEFLCLVMDLVPSGDLSEFVLTPRRLTAEQSRWAIMETVEVLSYMHGQKILYRDLKPENLLVDDEGHVRLIDMARGALDGREAAPHTRVGTDYYMAPEVLGAQEPRAYGDCRRVHGRRAAVRVHQRRAALHAARRPSRSPAGHVPVPRVRALRGPARAEVAGPHRLQPRGRRRDQAAQVL